MSSPYDVNRISPGRTYDKVDETNYLDITRRLVHIEQVMQGNLGVFNFLADATTDAQSSNRGYNTQFGTYAYTYAGGAVTINVALTSAWSSTHLMFFCYLKPAAYDATLRIISNGPNGVTQGTVSFTGTTSQTVNIGWMSIGR
jgi:hypothetical protein